MRKILIIEDDALTAKIYADYLTRAGFEVSVAPDGISGLEFLESSFPDAALVDMMMPKLNGIEFIKRVRANERFQNIPLFAYTTAFVPQMVEQAKAAGATDIYDKAKLSGPLLKGIFDQYFRQHS